MRAAIVLAWILALPVLMGAPSFAEAGSEAGGMAVAQTEQGSPPEPGSERAAPPPSDSDLNIELRTQVQEKAPDVQTGPSGGRWYFEPIWLVIGVAGVALILVIILLASRGGGGTTIIREKD